MTGNSEDFSDKTDPNQLHKDLLQECNELKIKVNYFKSISEFINKHSKLIEFIIEEWIYDKLGSYDLQTAFEEVLYDYGTNFLTDWARDKGVYVKETDYNVKYVEDFNITDFSIYEIDNIEYIIEIGLDFLAAVEFDWYDNFGYGSNSYSGGTEVEVFRFISEISVRVKDKEIAELKFIYLSSK